MNITVVKRNGQRESLTIEKWQAQVAKVCQGIADVINEDDSLEYYVYVYYREKSSLHGEVGSPYYVGIGKDKRAWTKGKGEVGKPTNKKYIIIEKTNVSVSTAKNIEIALVSYFGRIDLGTGILRNKTNGGDGTNGWVPTKEQLENKRTAAEENWKDETYRKKHSEGVKKGSNTIEAKENYSNASEKRWAVKREDIIKAQREGNQRPEVKANRSKVETAKWQDEKFIKKMTVTCEHCYRTMLKGQHNRWHGDNCKLKNNNNEMVGNE